MVAYNFKAQFAPLVQAGQKLQTIRALGKRRHARPGDALQLYTGMRTKGCRKLMPDIPCIGATPVEMDVTPHTGLSLFLGDTALELPAIIDLAKADGFGHDGSDPLDQFIRFFEARMPFKGVLIEWQPPRVTEGVLTQQDFDWADGVIESLKAMDQLGERQLLYK